MFIEEKLNICKIRNLEAITSFVWEDDIHAFSFVKPDPAKKIVNRKVYTIEPECYLWARVNPTAFDAGETYTGLAERFMNIKDRIIWDKSNIMIYYLIDTQQYPVFDVVQTFSFNFRNYGILNNGAVICTTDLEPKPPYKIEQGWGSWTWFEFGRKLTESDTDEIQRKLISVTKKNAKKFVEVWNKNYNEYMDKIKPC